MSSDNRRSTILIQMDHYPLLEQLTGDTIDGKELLNFFCIQYKLTRWSTIMNHIYGAKYILNIGAGVATLLKITEKVKL